MASQNVRISEASHQALQQLARLEGRSMQAILDTALDEYRHKKFWLETNAAFRRLSRNQRAWEQERKERALWENTLLDGTKNE